LRLMLTGRVNKNVWNTCIILMFEVSDDAAAELSLGRLEVSENGSLSTVVCLCFFGESNFVGYIVLLYFPAHSTSYFCF